MWIPEDPWKINPYPSDILVTFNGWCCQCRQLQGWAQPAPVPVFSGPRLRSEPHAAGTAGGPAGGPRSYGYISWDLTWKIHENIIWYKFMGTFIQNIYIYTQNMYIYIYTGWWFGTFVFHIIGNKNPNWLIFFRRVETTNQIYIYIYV